MIRTRTGFLARLAPLALLEAHPVGCTDHGDAGGPSGLAPAADRAYLQTLGPDGILFSRGIARVTADRLRRYWRSAEEGSPPAPEHDALTDAFLEKGATAYCCHEGEWLRFTTDQRS